MAHYSSHFIYYEDGIKPPLKSTTVKLLVPALYAQFRVGAGTVEYWALVMAYDSDPVFMETQTCYRPIHYFD